MVTDGEGTTATLALRSDGSIRRSLNDILEEILDSDQMRETLRAQGIDKAAVMAETARVLDEGKFDFEFKLNELLEAEKARNIALNPNQEGPYATLGAVIVIIGILGLCVFLVVGIAKWTGHLLAWPIWPFAVVPSLLTVGGSIITVTNVPDPAQTPDASENTVPQTLGTKTIETERLRRNLRDQLRSLVVVPAIEKASLPKFISPAVDTVYLTDAPGLTSRVESASRIQTRSYRDILPNLGREGGMTIGLAGNRGVGKSELLRAFCGEGNESPSIESGGIIGIVIPAPVAYKAELFLRVLIRRLAEAVPGYSTHLAIYPRKFFSIAAIITVILALLSFTIGIELLIGSTRMSHYLNLDRHALGWFLIGIGSLILVMLLVRIALKLNSIFWARGDPAEDRAQIWINWLTSIASRGTSPDAEAARINQRSRRNLAITANNVAQRMRYIESRSVESEGSAAWNNIGFKSTSALSLDQVPLSEPDLVAELTKFVANLSKGGYRVRIGIDELDKLVEGHDAEKFLTGMKNLFTIRDCSFLLTISDNAAAQFARRGMPIRDVFDSSLDTVIFVQPLTYQEARRLAGGRLRRLAESSVENISDSQILLCHCLAGGYPRDFLRYCRQLGELNSSLDYHQTLDKILYLLLGSDVRTRVDGVRSALRGRDQGESTAIFMAQLERIDAVSNGGESTFGVMRELMVNDSLFISLCRPIGQVTVLDELIPSREGDWLTYARRQLVIYLYFAETVRSAFGPEGMLARHGKDNPLQIMTSFEVLADARRRMEMDPAAGWRRITQARRTLGLPEVQIAAEPSKASVSDQAAGQP
jgi:hypothetical protein